MCQIKETFKMCNVVVFLFRDEKRWCNRHAGNHAVKTGNYIIDNTGADFDLFEMLECEMFVKLWDVLKVYHYFS